MSTLPSSVHKMARPYSKVSNMSNDDLVLWQSEVTRVPGSAITADDIVSYAQQLSLRDSQQIVSAFKNADYEIGSARIWMKAMAVLKKQLSSLGPEFVGEMLQRADIGPASDIRQAVTDYEAILLAQELGMANPTEAMRLRQAYETVRHFTEKEESEDDESVMTPEEAIHCLRACVQSVLARPKLEGAQDFLEPPLTNNASAWYEHFLQIAEMIKAVNLPVTIPVMQIAQGEDARVRPVVTIKPEDLEDIDLEVRFESVPRVVQFAEDESDRRDVELGFMSRSTYMGKKYDDPVREARQVDLDKVGLAAAEAANEFAIQFMKQMAPDIAQRLATEKGLPAMVQQQQGAASRPARPAGGSVPGQGAPVVPPVQAQGGAPPAVGSAARGTAQ